MVRVKIVLLVASLLCLLNGYSARAEWGEASMVSLISVPERFDNKGIGTAGFVALQSGLFGCFLYLTRYYAEHQVFANALILALKDSEVEKFRDLDGQMVYVRGTFRDVDSGSSPNGAIEHITDMVLYREFELRPPFGQLPPLK